MVPPVDDERARKGQRALRECSGCQCAADALYIYF
jgi:hypothetical protein